MGLLSMVFFEQEAQINPIKSIAVKYFMVDPFLAITTGTMQRLHWDAGEAFKRCKFKLF